MVGDIGITHRRGQPPSTPRRQQLRREIRALPVRNFPRCLSILREAKQAAFLAIAVVVGLHLFHPAGLRVYDADIAILTEVARPRCITGNSSEGLTISRLVGVSLQVVHTAGGRLRGIISGSHCRQRDCT